MVSQFEKDILKGTLALRFVIWLVSYLSDIFIDDHDHSSVLLLTTAAKPELTWISSLLKCFVRWDGLFYIGFVENDYEYLKNHAFFPLYAKIVSVLRDILFVPFKGISSIDSIIVTGILLNLVIHMANVILFYR